MKLAKGPTSDLGQLPEVRRFAGLPPKAPTGTARSGAAGPRGALHFARDIDVHLRDGRVGSVRLLRDSAAPEPRMWLSGADRNAKPYDVTGKDDATIARGVASGDYGRLTLLARREVPIPGTDPRSASGGRSATAARDKPVDARRRVATGAVPSAVSGLIDPYSAVGWNRPISELSGAGKGGVEALLRRFPGAHQALAPLLRLLPTGAAPGKSDVFRLELDTSLADGSFTLHAKLNVAALLSLPRDKMENMFDLAIAKAPTAQDKVEAIALKKMVMEWKDRPGLKDTPIFKTTDLRLTFNPTRSGGGFRVGFATLFVTPPIGGSKGPQAMIAVSPRVMFHKRGTR